MSGLYVEGELKAFRSEQWKNGKGVSHYLGIVVGTKTDEWGQTQETIIKVEVPQEQVAKATLLGERAKGRMVRVPVYHRVSEGKFGIWERWILPKDGDIEVMKAKLKSEAA